MASQTGGDAEFLIINRPLTEARGPHYRTGKTADREMSAMLLLVISCYRLGSRIKLL